MSPFIQVPLGAFVNTLIGNRLGTWMNTERPKFRGGMTHAPQSRNRRRRRGGADAPSTDADGARAKLRSEERAAAASRLCVRRRWGHCAWDSLMRQCMTVRDPEERL